MRSADVLHNRELHSLYLPLLGDRQVYLCFHYRCEQFLTAGLSVACANYMQKTRALRQVQALATTEMQCASPGPSPDNMDVAAAAYVR